MNSIRLFSGKSCIHRVRIFRLILTNFSIPVIGENTIRVSTVTVVPNGDFYRGLGLCRTYIQDRKEVDFEAA